MKKDINHFLQTRNLDGLMVIGPAQHNPAMVYFTGTVHLGMAILIQKRGEQPILFCQSMERDEAAHTGLQTRLLDDYPMLELLKQNNGDPVRASAARYAQILTDLGLMMGRIAVSGLSDAGTAYATFSALHALLPDLELVGEANDSVLMQAMETKDEQEVERIRQMGKLTTWVVGQTADFLSSHRAQDNVLIKTDGSPLLLGEVKGKINLWLAEKGAENPEGTIFSIGRDAGVPHSSGNPTDLMRLGQTIVYDIFPCESGGGYFYDFTRTWCLGYASDEAQALYDDVLSVYRQIMQEMKLGMPCRTLQARTCELFEAQGHPTNCSQPHTLEGYVHSLGHGVGLHIHERPSFGLMSSDSNRVEPGVVVTIEPGLYYPERGLGVRLEDTVWARPDGCMEVLAEYPLDLILPVRS